MPVEPQNDASLPQPPSSTVRARGRHGPGWAASVSRSRHIAVVLKHVSANTAKAFGTTPRFCPICNQNRRLFAFGTPLRLDAFCSYCGSLERHRQMVLWLQRNEVLWARKRILHFAPDTSVQSLLRSKAADYIGADIVAAPGCRVLDIEALDLQDGCVDVVVCSHVLEHVNDVKALSEMKRVLAKGGLLLIMVPIIHGWPKSYENPDVQTPAERLLHFGQDDHLRYYGDDIEKRISKAGFALTKFVAQEPDCLTYGLIRGDTLFIASA